MRGTSRVLQALASYLAMTAFVSLVAIGGPMEPDFALGGIKDGLKRSPEHYVAAVLEVVGAPTCDNAMVMSTCVNQARLVEVLASRGGRFEAGKVLTLVGNNKSGARYLGFLVPVEGQPGIYGATFLSVGPAEEERSGFVNELKKAGL